MRKRLLLMAFALLGTVGAWAETIVLEITPNMGTYVENTTRPSPNYAAVLNFNTEPVLTVSCNSGNNNMDKRVTNTFLLWHTGSSLEEKYNLTIPSGYLITKYSITGEANTSDQTVTAGNVSKTFTSGVSETIEITDLFTSTTSFTLKGENTGLKITSISVTVEEDNDKVQFENLLKTVRAINYGNGLNQYSLTNPYTEYIGNEEELFAKIESEYGTNYSAGIEKLLGVIDASILNKPEIGTFLRITGKGSGKHLAGGTATHTNGSTVYAMTDAEDATTTFYYDGTHLANFSTGLYNGMKAKDGNDSGWEWKYGNENASEVLFGDGNTNGGYLIRSGGLINNQYTYFYDAGAKGYVDRGGMAAGTLPTDVNYLSWSLTYVNTLPITISEAGYATLYTPVALEIPTDVTAYTGMVNGDYFVLDEVKGNVIPANTAVVLAGAAKTYNFTITTSTDVISSDLKGSMGIAAADYPASILTLQKPEGAADYGFYTYDNENGLAAFKAYLSLEEANIKGLTFSFGTTDGIATVEGATKEDAAIYNLAGQRVEKAVKGVYIINGKKVLVK